MLEAAASNADSQLILEDNCEKLDRYLTENAATTDDLIKACGEIAGALNESSGVKVPARKLLRRLVGLVDWTVQCCGEATRFDRTRCSYCPHMFDGRLKQGHACVRPRKAVERRVRPRGAAYVRPRGAA